MTTHSPTEQTVQYRTVPVCPGFPRSLFAAPARRGLRTFTTAERAKARVLGFP